jgi:hypothetical protein
MLGDPSLLAVASASPVVQGAPPPAMRNWPPDWVRRVTCLALFDDGAAVSPRRAAVPREEAVGRRDAALHANASAPPRGGDAGGGARPPAPHRPLPGLRHARPGCSH